MPGGNLDKRAISAFPKSEDTYVMKEVKYNESIYKEKLEKLFVRYPSVQNSGFGNAYKPGLEHMWEFTAQLGHPERSFRSIHVAGTNGKGSVANMLAAALSATGQRVGLYTSPHILDFRERMRIIDGRRGRYNELAGCASDEAPDKSGSRSQADLISREDVWEFITKRERDFEELGLSFFEITTGMAFWWFARQEVDIAVIEVGLGGRLDSTNIITPELCVITSIGLDHCALLGNTRAEIAAEKAGIFKPGVPALVGAWDEETAPVFERAAAEAGAVLHFADGGGGTWSGNAAVSDGGRDAADSSEAGGVGLGSGGSGGTVSVARADLSRILARMDLQGAYQKQNLRTTLAALEVLAGTGLLRSEAGSARDASVRRGGGVAAGGVSGSGEAAGENAGTERLCSEIIDAITGTARLMGFHGRWELISRDPDTICDIGHNPPALTQNFAQLRNYLRSRVYSKLIIVYGAMADKDLDGILPLMPEEATYICVAPATPRALKADALYARCRSYWESAGRDTSRILMASTVGDGIKMAEELAEIEEDILKDTERYDWRGQEDWMERESELAETGSDVVKKAGEGVRRGGEEMADAGVGNVINQGEDAVQKRKTLIYIGGSTFVVSEAVTKPKMPPSR